MEFKMPPSLRNDKGELRKAGFEIEFGGVELEEVAGCIISLYGGSHYRESNFLQEVRDTQLGKFSLKMDARMLTERTYEKVLDTLGIDNGNSTDDVIESIASLIVPYEVGTPPVNFAEISRLDALRRALLQHKASGTHASVFHAYAVHINAEAPALNAATMLRYMRAFLLLYPWLFFTGNIALRRRIASYIRPFPEDYTEIVLSEDYKPDFDKLLQDYHEYNPDRNRPLDFYPVFACISEEKVRDLGDIGNVKPRPAFHYRLPNSEVDEVGWSLAVDWNKWVEIEKLAEDASSIKSLSAQYLRMKEDSLIGFSSKWKDYIQDWMNEEKAS